MKTHQNLKLYEEVLLALVPWQQLLNEFQNKVVGTSRVFLQQQECGSGECNLGNFYTDAMLHAFIKKSPYNSKTWSNVSIALTTQGNFRVPLNAGNITYSQLNTMCPWENKLYALTLRGEVLRDLFEDCVAPMKITQNIPRSSRFLQVSGIKIIYNITKPIGSRIVEVKVRCQHCLLPVYEKLDLEKDYRLVVMEYLANGKNGFSLISDNAKDMEEGPNDLEALMAYMQSNNPIVAGLEGRIKILK